MAYVISDACISCGACEGTCPAGAISEGDGQYVIDADTCLDCGACADGCPAGAISRNNFQVRILFKQQKEMHFYASLFCSIYSLTCFDVGRDSIAPSVAIDKAAV